MHHRPVLISRDLHLDVASGADEAIRLLTTCHVIPRDERDSRGGSHFSRSQLAGQRDHLGRRPDEPQALIAGDGREQRTLRQEAIARVNRVAAGGECGVHDCLGA